VTIDGIEANEASNPTATNNVFRINPDNVEEFKTTTSNGTPEEGKNSGLNVNMVTKSGTNKLHGDLTYYFRNQDLNSNEFYANAQGQPRVDWSPKLRQPVKSQNSSNGELTHGNVPTEVHEGKEDGRGSAAGNGRIGR
jgi:hypothetical protein